MLLDKNQIGEQYLFCTPQKLLRVTTTDECHETANENQRIQWDPPRCKIDQLQIKLSNKCNFECRHCLENSSRNEHGFLYFNSWKDFLNDFAVHNSNGIVVLTGGEPLLHPNIEEIVTFLLQIGLQVRLFTNGALLDSNRITQKTISQLDLIQLSLDGFSKDINDNIRDKGAFDAVTKSLEICSALNVPVRISCVLCDQNIEDVKNNCEKFFSAYCNENVSLNFSRIEPKGRGIQMCEGEESGLKAQAEIRAFFASPHDKQTIDSAKVCGYGNSLTIDHKGGVFACPSELSRLPEPISLQTVLNELSEKWRVLFDRAKNVCTSCHLAFTCKAGCFLENEESCDEVRKARTLLRMKYGFLE